MHISDIADKNEECGFVIAVDNSNVKVCIFNLKKNNFNNIL